MREKLRYALIGCGRIAPNHIAAYLNNAEDLELCAVCDPVSERMEAVLRPLPEQDRARVRRYTDHRELLAKEAPQLCAVATESGLHAQVGLDVLRAGSNVIIEKPLALSLADARALIAEAVNAELYENWTDVNGFLTADPRIVDHPSGIRELSYRELRELAYMGANVLHPESIFPVRAGGIPINIRNTFEPENKGTMIVPEITDSRRGNTITGIAGKKGYSIIYIEKSMMNSEIGFARKVLSVLEYYNIGFEHMPSGIDTLSIVVADSEIAGRQEVVLDKIQKTVNPDHVEIKDGISLIATVGHGMSFKPGTAAKLCGALATAGVNIRMIDQGSSEMNIIVGVATQDYEKAVRAIYKAFE